MKSKILSIVGVLMIGLILVGCGNSIVKKSIEQANTAIGSKEYNKALASVKLALDEDKENEEANKLYSIVDGYQKAKKQVDENKILEAKGIIYGINKDYINYTIKDDIDNLKSQIDNKLKEAENTIIEAQRLCDEGNYDKSMNYIETVILSNGSNYTEEQQKRVNDILKVIADKVEEEKKKQEEAKRAEENRKKEEAQRVEKQKKSEQSSEKRYYVPHLNKSFTMDEMFNEYNKSAIPFDYVGEDGKTYMFNPGSTKPNGFNE